MDHDDGLRQAKHRERWQLLRTLDEAMEGPLVVLSFAWLIVLVLEFVVGTDTRLTVVFYSIWVVFIAEVAIELLIAPNRLAYLRSDWLKVISLAIPALRALRLLTALRFLRAGAAVRSASMLRLLTSLNRGMGALSRTLDRTGFVYVLLLTVLVIVVGSAGLLFFEASTADGGPASEITSYGEALWWTAMAMTTIGAESAPATTEGRLVGWLLSLYAIGVFGYFTATIASHFLGLSNGPSAVVAPPADSLEQQIASLRSELAELTAELAQARLARGGG
jgi:voltage-gated potassium channel